MTVRILVAVALLGAASGSYAHAAGKTLSGRQIRDLMTGTTVYFAPRGRPAKLHFTFHAGGGMTAVIKGGKRKADRGQWSVRKNRALCIKWQHIGQGKQHCFTLLRTGNRIDRFSPRKGSPAPGGSWTIVRAGPGVGRVGAPEGAARSAGKRRGGK